jgi:hypothetical protein
MPKFALVFSAVLLSVFSLNACSTDTASTPLDANPFGARSYKLDPEAAAIQLSIYGVQMGTPDARKFQFLMRTLKNAGELVSLIEKSPGIEGGLTICGVFSSQANHDEIYEVVRSIETDAKNTNFAAVSVEGCTN